MKTFSTAKSVHKFARIVQGTGFTKRNDVPIKFSIMRLELRVLIEKTVPIDVQLSNKDFEWLVNAIRHDHEKSCHVGRKMLQFVKVGDGSYTLSSIDNSKCFGIQFIKNELEKIIENQLLIKFLLEKQKVSGDELKNITINLFIGEIGTLLIDKIACGTCLGGGHSKADHQCAEYFRNRSDQYTLIDEIISDRLFEVKFHQNFDKLMNLLNVNSSDKLEQIQLEIPEIKKDFPLLILKLSYFIDMREGAAVDIMNILNCIT